MINYDESLTRFSVPLFPKPLYQAEAEKWEGLIESAAHDLGLPRDRRAAAITALRLRQQAAAKAAQQRVMEDEKGKAKAFMRTQQPRAALG